MAEVITFSYYFSLKNKSVSSLCRLHMPHVIKDPSLGKILYGHVQKKNNIYFHFFKCLGPKTIHNVPDTHFFPYILSNVYYSETTNNEKYDHHSLGVRA